MSANNEEHGAEKLGRGAATVAKYGREYMRELGRRGNQAKRERKASIRFALQHHDQDAWVEIANRKEVWERVMRLAFEQNDLPTLRAMLQYCADRTHGKATQTHLVAVQHEVRLSDAELERVRQVARQIKEAQQRPALTVEAEERARLGLPPARESEIVAQCSARWSGPAPAESGAPASAESPRDLDALPADLGDQLLRANGITLPGHPLPPAPPRDPRPRCSGPSNARSR